MTRSRSRNRPGLRHRLAQDRRGKVACDVAFACAECFIGSNRPTHGRVSLDLLRQRKHFGWARLDTDRLRLHPRRQQEHSPSAEPRWLLSEVSRRRQAEGTGRARLAAERRISSTRAARSWRKAGPKAAERAATQRWPLMVFSAAARVDEADTQRG